MSLKGLQKSVIRAPQQFRSKFNIGEHTKDLVYVDAERRFNELETETKRLHDESKKYFEAINGMLSHQIEFSKAMTEIYRPISGRMSDPESMQIMGSTDGIRACEEYAAVMKDLQETLAPELEMIESRVVRPANELMDVIKVVRKATTKRERKKLDYDRHRATLKKLQDKKDKSIKDEKAMWKAENDVEVSTEEFNLVNDLLKEELPRLFSLERAFIQPLFQSFYYMQLNIFFTLHEKMQQCDIGYFDLTLDIEEAFHQKRGDIREQAEQLSIVKFKTTGMRRPLKYGGAKPSLTGPSRVGLLTAGPSTSTTTSTQPRWTPPSATSASAPPSASILPEKTFGHQRQHSDTIEPPPPPYSPDAASPASGSSSTFGHRSSLALVAAAKAKPPPPKPKPSRFSAAPVAETVTALYDYSAQAEGDLSFRAGDVITIVSRTQNDNEWWTGKLNGKEGQFPGNYVQVN